jgi:hypothetical protein
MAEDLTSRYPDHAVSLAKAFVTAHCAGGAGACHVEPGGPSAQPTIDWAAIRHGVAAAASLERAVGRAVVLAARSARGQDVGEPAGVMTLDPALVEPFFAFSVSEVVPDFGDHRPRTWLSHKVTRILRRDGESTSRSSAAHGSSANGTPSGVEDRLRQPSLS